jgi:hypothetical protein
MPLQEELEKQGVWLFRYRGTLPLVILGIGGLLYFQTELNPETLYWKTRHMKYTSIWPVSLSA